MTNIYFYKSKIRGILKSVESLNLCKSVIQTIYDIVKAHGGELKVETKDGEGSEFIVTLPTGLS